jgi:branched-chain amino acid transport system ATP-binding protein
VTLLAVEDARVRFGRFEAVAGVSLSVAAGRAVGLVGPNGAGKTSLLDAVCGLVPLAGGRVTFAGVDATRLSPQRRARLGLGRTFQAHELFADLTAVEHVRVAAEAGGSGRDRQGRAQAALAAAGLSDPAVADRPPDRLTHAERAALGLARALATGRGGRLRLVVLDEPFAGLDAATRRSLAGRLRTLADGGVAVLVADHDLELVLDLCDEVCVLDFGRVVAFGPPAAVRADERVAAAYLGREAAGGGVPAGRSAGSGSGPGAGPTALEARGVSAGYGGAAVVHGVDLSVRAGEVVALLGPNGAGKTTLLRALSGLVPLLGGSAAVLGEAGRGLHPHRLARRGLAHVQQDRGVLGGLTVAENLRLVRGPAATDGGVDAVLDRFPALRPLLRRRAGLLSGGEQHLLALARALAASPRLLLVDELSLGLAPAAARQALAAVRDAAAGGAGVLVVEQHAQLALEIADRAVVLDRGRVSFEGAAAALAARPEVLHAAYFGEAPPRE